MQLRAPAVTVQKQHKGKETEVRRLVEGAGERSSGGVNRTRWRQVTTQTFWRTEGH